MFGFVGLPMMPPARNIFCSICCVISLCYNSTSWNRCILTKAITMVVSSGPHGASFRILDVILMKKKTSCIMVTTI